MTIYTVIRQQLLPASPAEVWLYLTDVGLLARWFADAERLAPGEPCRFEFGDGDFFEGRVAVWDEPTLLELRWKFMGVGPEYEIRYSLLPVGDATELSVQDRGALELGEAHALREGWKDFLTALAEHAETGRTTRYEWNEALGMAALLRAAPDSFAVEQELDVWRAAFPVRSLAAAPAPRGALRLDFRADEWGDVVTRAEVETRRLREGTYVSVTHDGWVELPRGRRVAERRRFARLWAEALGALERKYF